MKNIGYCCINLSLNKNLSKKDQITVNRGMIKKTFDSKGISYASELALLNLTDVLKILEWNVRNNIHIYRLSSDLFPWMSHFNFTDLPNFKKIESVLIKIGKLVKSNNIRIGFHPGQFNVLASENDRVVENTISELNKHSEILDYMGLDMNPYYSINIHIGTTKPTLQDAADKFCNNFQYLSESTKKRLTVENDDSVNQFSVNMLHNMIYKKIGIPIIVDSLHYQCHTDNISWSDTLMLGASTWKDIKPLCHHSSSRKLYEDGTSKLAAHADFLHEKFDMCGLDVDIELECKQKDISLFKYRKDFL